MDKENQKELMEVKEESAEQYLQRIAEEEKLSPQEIKELINIFRSGRKKKDEVKKKDKTKLKNKKKMAKKSKRRNR